MVGGLNIQSIEAVLIACQIECHTGYMQSGTRTRRSEQQRLCYRADFIAVIAAVVSSDYVLLIFVQHVGPGLNL